VLPPKKRSRREILAGQGPQPDAYKNDHDLAPRAELHERHRTVNAPPSSPPAATATT
jgi:hypothetical protein